MKYLTKTKLSYPLLNTCHTQLLLIIKVHLKEIKKLKILWWIEVFPVMEMHGFAVPETHQY